MKWWGEEMLLFWIKLIRYKFFDSHFDSFARKDFARAGNEATASITLTAPDAEGGFLGMPFTMIEPLRALGMVVKMNKGKIELEKDFQVCREGDELTPEQAKTLVRCTL